MPFTSAGLAAVLSASPFVNCVTRKLTDKAYAFTLELQRFPGVYVQVNLNILPARRGGLKLMVCFGTMREGCFYDCDGCEGVLGGKNLNALEIAFQVYHALLESGVDPDSFAELEFTSFGIGEPFMNAATVEVVTMLHEDFPKAGFIISTHGPRSGSNVFNGLVGLARLGVKIDLQFSIDILTDPERFLYMDRTDLAGIKSWTLQEMADKAGEWLRLTGRMPIINFLVSPSMPKWQGSDYISLTKWFPPPMVIKLSVESWTLGGSQDVSACEDEMYARQGVLSRLGWAPEVFSLPATHLPGGGCGALVSIGT